MADLARMLPLLVSMRSMCDALLVEIAEEQNVKKAAKKKGLGLNDIRDHTHILEPGFGSEGVCMVCGETIAREVKDG